MRGATGVGLPSAPWLGRCLVMCLLWMPRQLLLTPEDPTKRPCGTGRGSASTHGDTQLPACPDSQEAPYLAHAIRPIALTPLVFCLSQVLLVSLRRPSCSCCNTLVPTRRTHVEGRTISGAWSTYRAVKRTRGTGRSVVVPSGLPALGRQPAPAWWKEATAEGSAQRAPSGLSAARPRQKKGR